MPFFSIVIPVYNRAKYIAATINSVLEQEFDDYELIIVNDGSTDNTEEVIRNNFNNKSKIKYIWQSNSERGTARNNGYKMASGKYVVFLDSDDLMQPECLAILNKKIIEQRYPNFLTMKYFLRRGVQDSASSLMKSLKEGYYDINLILRGAIFACNFVVRRDNAALYLFVEDRKYSSSEDWIFAAQNLKNDQIYLVNKYLIIMNDHDNRSMRGNNIDILNNRLAATVYIEENIVLTSSQKKLLWGNSYHFCAVHSYVEGRRISTLQYLIKSIRLSGINKMKLLLLVKNIIGYKMIQNFKRNFKV